MEERDKGIRRRRHEQEWKVKREEKDGDLVKEKEKAKNVRVIKLSK